MLENLFFWGVLFSIEAGMAFILFLFFIHLTRKSRVYLPLLIFTLLSFLELSILVLTHTGIIKSVPYLIDINEPFFMLFGLLLFLYARNQVHQQFVFKKSDLLFFVPFVLAFATYLPDFFNSNAQKISQLNLESDKGFDVIRYIWEWNFYLIVNIFFLLKALKELKVYNFKLKNQFSNVTNASLYYTQLLIKICLVLYIVELIFTYATYYGVPNYNEVYLLLNALSVVILLFVGIDAIKSHKNILNKQFSQIELPVITKIESNKETIKYAGSGLNKENSLKLKERLLLYMETHKPYLKPKLRIKDLSDATGISTHHLSQIINESFELNFYEFINGYRIKDAVKILKNPKYKNYTYEAIAFEVGFNSRSTFYTAFKKINNTTPSKFK